jgi:hypothetical protein
MGGEDEQYSQSHSTGFLDRAFGIFDPRTRPFQLPGLPVWNESEFGGKTQRPAMIQELWWQRSFGESSPPGDPVREVVFSFYNGDLFRMVVTYDGHRTEGLTDDDMIEAISAKYGTVAKPVAAIILFSSSQIYNENEKVIALWEDSQYSYNLYHSSKQPNFGILIFSKRLDALAQAAIVEAMRLDNQEARQREKARQEEEKEAAEDR